MACCVEIRWNYCDSPPLSWSRYSRALLSLMFLSNPAKMQYDAELYIALQRSLYVQWGPPHIGGALEPSAIAATSLLAFLVRKRKRGLWFSLGALFALLLAFPVVFFWLVAPANAVFLAATLPSIPPNWTDLRSNWEMGHAIRFALQVAALALLVLSLALDAALCGSARDRPE
jgi:hypothetical protein